MTATPSAPTLPSASELDRLDAGAFARAVTPLFEAAPLFVALLAVGRPYGSYPALLEAARRIAHEMPEGGQIELIDSHPRIGAPPGSVSALSYAEQGYHREKAGLFPPQSPLAPAAREARRSRRPAVLDASLAAEEEQQRIDEALRIGNDAYEKLFGFRFVVFVAGRPRSAIVPELITRLGAKRDEEITRALDAVIAIAADRVRKLRGEEAP
jgi:2-oxo-4-hydroxy-4-carboxy--5-ureidoimidazoline (OHCU) decarboxylase